MLRPWWVRWLVIVLVMSVIAVPAWMLLMAGGTRFTLSTALLAVQGLVFGVVLGTAMTVLTLPQHRSVTVALDGLAADQRHQAVRVLTGGEIPSDPAVLSGAIRLGTRVLGLGRRAPVWVRRVQPWFPALFAVLAGGQVLNHEPSKAAAYLGLAAVMAAAQWWERRSARRMQARVTLLRSAAEGVPGAVPAVGDDDQPPVPSTRTAVLMAVALVVVLVSVMVSFRFFTMDRPHPGCQAADAAMSTLLTDHRDLLDVDSMRPGGPDLSEYRDWSRALHGAAAQAAGTDVGTHLQRIAEHADGVVALAGVTRANPTIEGDRQQVLALIQKMLDEVGAVQDICYDR